MSTLTDLEAVAAADTTALRTLVVAAGTELGPGVQLTDEQTEKVLRFCAAVHAHDETLAGAFASFVLEQDEQNVAPMVHKARELNKDDEVGPFLRALAGRLMGDEPNEEALGVYNALAAEIGNEVAPCATDES